MEGAQPIYKAPQYPSFILAALLYVDAPHLHSSLRETLIKSQNQISYGFLSIASSTSFLNSSLFASDISSLCIKIQE